MATRKILGTLMRTSTEPWSNARVRIKLSKGSFDSDNQYPPDTYTVLTNSEGHLISTDSEGAEVTGVFLESNDDWEIPVEYEIFLPGRDSFKFNLPYDTGLPIQLSVLRATSTTPTEGNTTILEYIDDRFESLNITVPVYVASEEISALKIVALDSSKQLIIADTNTPSVFGIVGLIKSAVSVGESSEVLTGVITDSNWSWTPGTNIYLGSAGAITQTYDLTNTYVVTLGVALTSDTINLNPSKPIIVE